MPRKDGTGPYGSGPISRGAGRRPRRGGTGMGPTGYCICPECGEKIGHTTGVPCTSLKCPKCGSPLVRGS